MENAKVIALTGNNAFSVKKLLSVEDLTTNYLVYIFPKICRKNVVKPRKSSAKENVTPCTARERIPSLSGCRPIHFHERAIFVKQA